MEISSHELSVLAEYIHANSGIVLDQDKAYLLETRLGPLLATQQCDYLELHRRALSDHTGTLRGHIIDAISTHETSFFRDSHAFHLLSDKLLPDHFDNNGRELKIWCAASSTGQEIYSIAMTIKELLGDLDEYEISILGTDISEASLDAASSAIYTQLEVSRGLSDEQIRMYFTQVGTDYRFSDELRSLASFQKVNLVDLPATLGSFDMIFCRNVAIYFSRDNRRTLMRKLRRHLRPAGIVIVGGTETLVDLADLYSRHEDHNSTYYRPA